MGTRFFSLVATCALAVAAPVAAQDATPLTKGYHRFAQVQTKLRGWASQNPKRVKLLELGKSAGGRKLLALRIAAPGKVGPDRRPAVFVGANIAGFHNPGSEAALHLIARLLAAKPGPKLAALLRRVTFYVAPVLNPDAHDALFAKARWRRQGNGQPLDRDRDGLVGEDGPNDLDGDGRITWLRIPDPAGKYLPDPQQPALMVEADPLEGQRGRFRLEREGDDDDHDGAFNEDGRQGVYVDRNFAHAFPYPAPEAGPWASYAPEAKAVMDFLLARRNVALAVVYGPANTLLTLPPPMPARPKPKGPATAHSPRRRGRTAITRPPAEDVQVLRVLAKAYRKRLEQAGLDPTRPGKQVAGGGFAPWLYFHYGVLALELDVWGVPAKKKKKKEPPRTPRMPRTPKRKEKKEKEGKGKGKGKGEGEGKGKGKGKGKTPERVKPELARRRAVLAWVKKHRPQAIAPWTQVTLADGTKAEVGGLDPFAELLPPPRQLAKALAAHTGTVLALASKLARVEIAAWKVSHLGSGVFRLEVSAGNRGFLPTHTRMAVEARNRLPVRLELTLPAGARLVTGQRWRSAERLAGSTGALKASWLLKATPGAKIELRLTSNNAGRAAQTIKLEASK